MAKRACAFKHCTLEPTTLIVDVFPEYPLFKTGAGLVCDQHAADCDDKGVRVKLDRGTKRRMRL